MGCSNRHENNIVLSFGPSYFPLTPWKNRSVKHRSTLTTTAGLTASVSLLFVGLQYRYPDRMEPLDFLTVHTWWWEGSVHSVDAILWILIFWMVSDLWKNASCDSGPWRWATTPYSHRAEGETMPEAQWVSCTRSIMAYDGSGSHWFVGGQCKSREWVCEP